MGLFETEYQHEKILTLCRDEFFEDFDFDDVEKSNVLPFSDLKAISRCMTKEDRVDKLFFLLVIRGQTAFQSFLCELKKNYPWLATKIERYLNTEQAYNNINENYPDDYCSRILRLRKELPKFVDFNIHRCDLLWEIRQKILALSPHHQYLVVHGSLSQGKRWIVMDALCSYQIMNRTGGNIFWINCSKCKTPECILMQLEKLFIKSQPNHEMVFTPSNYKDINNKILNYTESLRRIFEKGTLKDSLLVLIDVQNMETIRAFDLNCRTLITTRDKKLLDHFSDATLKVEVDCGFTVFECKELFSKVLGTPINRLPDEVIDIHRMCKHNPFVISVIATNLKRYKSSIVRWKYWKNLLENNKSTSCPDLRRPIEESLKDLSRSNELLMLRLESLVIFTDNVNIPMKVLQLYWNLSPTEVEHIVEELSGLYLLQTIVIDHEMYCSLHYLYYTYLANHISSEVKQSMHFNLVAGYRIKEAFENRTEPNIADLPNDEYFHYYIGYHLKESGQQARDLFPLLYYDFGFLEQKLRYTGLSNTLGDFKLYANEIKGNDEPRIPIDDLTDFLAYNEEILSASTDTCLLQHALSDDHHIGAEARQQAMQFGNRVWFSDIDHSVKYRQIIKLPDHIQPKYINFIEPDASLIAFSDNSIYLIDMSYEYTVKPSIYTGHTCAICDIQLFLEHYFVSLDVSGLAKVWTLKDTEISRRRKSRQEDQRIGARQSITSPKSTDPIQYQLQNIDKPCPFTSILILHENKKESPRLLAATINNKILVYQWLPEQKQFELRQSESFQTRDTNNTNIVKMIVIQRHTLMTVNNKGETHFYNLIDNSMVPRAGVNFPNETPLNVYRLSNITENPTMSDQHTIAVIFPSGIYRLQISRIRQVIGNSGERNGRQIVEQLSDYKLSAEQNSITCCTITDDGNYLMLGTKKGIIVLDPKTNREILRSSISDKLTSIDVCTVTNSECKYMLISATKKGNSVVYVHGIHFKNDLMQWSTNKISSPMSGRDTMVAWFRGENVFDVCETNDDENNERYMLVAADLKDLVHTKQSTDNFNQTLFMDPFENRVTHISIGAKRKFVACKNGIVYEITTEQVVQMTFDESIEYLKYFDEMDVLIASTHSKYRVVAPRKSFAQESKLIQNTFVYGTGLIIILKIDGSFEFLDMSSYKLIQSNVSEQTDRVICSCFCNDKIAIGTSQRLSIYEIKVDSNYPSIVLLSPFEIDSSSTIKSIALTESDKLMIAVGYKNGVIDLFEANGLKIDLLNKLISHKHEVNSMHFSTWHKNPYDITGVPIILVSLSSEICFWNITHALNNPMERTSHRQSLRFNRIKSKTAINDNSIPFGIRINGNNTHSITKEMNEINLDTKPTNYLKKSTKTFNGNERIDENPWIGKCGSTQKPALLSCVKFVGSSAEKMFINKQFTTFITIDNEGEVYYLRILDFLKSINS